LVRLDVANTIDVCPEEKQAAHSPRDEAIRHLDRGDAGDRLLFDISSQVGSALDITLGRLAGDEEGDEKRTGRGLGIRPPQVEIRLSSHDEGVAVRKK
jgi:hypothetical protein